MKLKDVATNTLIKELLTRRGVEKIAVDPYKTRDLIAKNGCLPKPTDNAYVLTISPTYDGTESPHKRGWRRFELITNDPVQIAELNKTLDTVKLSRHQLAVIVSSLRVRHGFSLEDFQD